MRGFLWLPVFVMVAGVLLAGCMSDELYALNLGGVPEDVNDTFEAESGEVRISVNAGGAGTAVVTLTDAAGAEVFSQSYGTGGNQGSRTVSGAAGTWTIEVDFRGWSGGFQLAITSA